MNFMRWLIPAPKVEAGLVNGAHVQSGSETVAYRKPSPLIDLQRRGFIFGAAATLIIPPVRTFHFLPKQELIFPELITVPSGKLFDLPNREALKLWMKLLDEKYLMKDLPQWVVCDKQWYDTVVKAQERGSKFERPTMAHRPMAREAARDRSEDTVAYLRRTSI